MGIISGGIEVLTEKIGLDEAVGSFTKNPSKFAAFVRSMASEGKEEVAANVLNRIVDVTANGDRSQIAQLYQSYLASGSSKGQALAETIFDILQEDAVAFAGGAMAGGIVSGMTAVNNRASYSQMGQSVKNTQSVDPLLNYAKANGLSDVAGYNGTNLSDIQAGHLTATVESDIFSKIEGATTQAELAGILEQVKTFGNSRIAGEVNAYLQENMARAGSFRQGTAQSGEQNGTESTVQQGQEFTEKDPAAKAEDQATIYIVGTLLDPYLQQVRVGSTSTLDGAENSGYSGTYLGMGAGTDNLVSQLPGAGGSSSGPETGGITAQPDGSRGGGDGNGFGGIPGQGETAGGRTRLSANEVLGVTVAPDGRAILQTANGDVDASTAELEGGVTADTIKLAQLYGKNGLPPRSDSPIARMAYEAGTAERAEETRRAGETAAGARSQGADAGTEGAGESLSGKIYTPVEYKGTVKVNGEVKDVSRRVYQRNDIDIDFIDEKLALTNLERMQNGKPPIGSDGKPIELHHVLQQEAGPMAEIREITHQAYYAQLHGLIEHGASFRNNPILNYQYNNFRYNYWKWRANQIIGGNKNV